MKKLIFVLGYLFLSPPLYSETNIKEGPTEYNIVCQGHMIDKNYNQEKNQIFVSVTKKYEMEEEVIFVRIEAIAETAKKTIDEWPIYLPGTVNSSLQYVAKRVFVMKGAKTKKTFERAKLNYIKALKDVDDLVSINGFRIVEDSYAFEKGKTIKI